MVAGKLIIWGPAWRRLDIRLRYKRALAHLLRMEPRAELFVLGSTFWSSGATCQSACRVAVRRRATLFGPAAVARSLAGATVWLANIHAQRWPASELEFPARISFNETHSGRRLLAGHCACKRVERIARVSEAKSCQVLRRTRVARKCASNKGGVCCFYWLS